MSVGAYDGKAKVLMIDGQTFSGPGHSWLDTVRAEGASLRLRGIRHAALTPLDLR